MAIYRRLWFRQHPREFLAGRVCQPVNQLSCVKMLLIFSNSCNNLTCHHHQAGSSCTCPVDMSSLVTRCYITVQNYSMHQWLWSAHLSKRMTTVVWCTYQVPRSYNGAQIFACRQNTINSSFFCFSKECEL